MKDARERAREVYEEILEFIIPHGVAEAFVERRIAAYGEEMRRLGREEGLDEAAKFIAAGPPVAGVVCGTLSEHIRALKEKP